MDERILIIRRCNDCPEKRHDGSYAGDAAAACSRTGRTLNYSQCAHRLPGWCPLSPAPGRMEKPRKEKGTYERGYLYGWNACVSAMHGDGDEGETEA